MDDALVRDATDAYSLGLWCADGYWWSSSIGLSNTEPELIVRFGSCLLKDFSRDRLRLRIYKRPEDIPDPRVLALTDRVSVRPPFKMKRIAYHVYVNSRPLVRRFFRERSRIAQIDKRFVGAYIAGRFDGDGTFGVTPRIVYRSESEAEVDSFLLTSTGITGNSVLFYKKANEYCIYIHKAFQEGFGHLMMPFSWKADRRFTL